MPAIAHPATRVLPVPPARWPPPGDRIRLEAVEFAPKNELHVTLVGNALGRELRAVFGARARALVDAAFDAQDWRFRRTGCQLLLRKAYADAGTAHVAHSIVELVELPAMAPFHRALGHALGRQLPLPPPHVTLYTAGRAQGIGVSSLARLRAFTLRELLAGEGATARAD
ncbi:MAG TPA: hypothetical protein VM619_12070 [Luteimonas sp.]|nr:hypothetical protein [Luteimonas sp.]